MAADAVVGPLHLIADDFAQFEAGTFFDIVSEEAAEFLVNYAAFEDYLLGDSSSE